MFYISCLRKQKLVSGFLWILCFRSQEHVMRYWSDEDGINIHSHRLAWFLNNKINMDTRCALWLLRLSDYLSQILHLSLCVAHLRIFHSMSSSLSLYEYGKTRPWVWAWHYFKLEVSALPPDEILHIISFYLNITL